MKILIDGMGGDNAPQSVVDGAILAAKEIEHEIIIIGDTEKIAEALGKYREEDIPKTISVCHASEVITNNESPAMAIRRKKDSSIVKGMKMLKDGEVDLFISAGSTGALLAGGLLLIGRIKGIDRPAICTIYPILGKEASLLCDAGANAECKARNLVDFAIMSSIYMEKVLGRENPTVALVNIGEEEENIGFGAGFEIGQDAGFPLFIGSSGTVIDLVAGLSFVFSHSRFKICTVSVIAAIRGNDVQGNVFSRSGQDCSQNHYDHEQHYRFFHDFLLYKK